MPHWSGISEFKQMSKQMACAGGNSFTEMLLPYLRIKWKSLQKAPSKLPMDFFVWSQNECHPVVVQSYGFELNETELDASLQARCHARIKAFQSSGVKADLLVFVHNKDGRNRVFRESLVNVLQDLTDAGQIKKYAVWDRSKVLTESFDAMQSYLRLKLAESTKNILDIFSELEPVLCEPIERVPMKISQMVADQYRLRETSPAIELLGDPAVELLMSKQTYLIMTGEFGHGKTTASLRVLQSQTYLQILFVVAATISSDTTNSKDLIAQCVPIDEFLSPFEPSDRNTLKTIARSVVYRLLTMPGSKYVILIDGLDESIYVTRNGGMQWLLNSLRGVNAPIVLTLRSELWDLLQYSFATPYGPISKKTSTNVRRSYQLIELLPWTDEQIAELIRRYHETIVDISKRNYLSQLLSLVENHQYEEIYGDIPRRPLFLRFILETVMEQGVQSRGKAALLTVKTPFL